jgi:hypothetical protein
MEKLFSSAPARLPRHTLHVAVPGALFTVMLALGAFAFAPAAQATAGARADLYGSKQLAIVYLGHPHALSVLIAGANQHGEQVHQCFDTPTSLNLDRGQWWRGLLKLSFFRFKMCTNFSGLTERVFVPVGPGNWYPVYVPWIR